jgi:hypothetical protein
MCVLVLVERPLCGRPPSTWRGLAPHGKNQRSTPPPYAPGSVSRTSCPTYNSCPHTPRARSKSGYTSGKRCLVVRRWEGVPLLPHQRLLLNMLCCRGLPHTRRVIFLPRAISKLACLPVSCCVPRRERHGALSIPRRACGILIQANIVMHTIKQKPISQLGKITLHTSTGGP